MTKSIRAYFFYTFAIFFIVSVPFLVFFSLGFYDFNFSDQQLSNSLSITIETRPRQADIYNNTILVLKSSGELTARENQIIPLEIREEGFISEQFLLAAPPDENSTARLTNLWLLPNTANEIQDFEDNELISIISDDFVLFREDGNIFIQVYSFGGLQGSGQVVSGSRSDLQSITPATWVELDNKIFWQKDSGLILMQINDQWQVYSTSTLAVEPAQIVYINSSSLLVLGVDGTLWIWNTQQQTFRFFDSGYTGITFTDIPASIWLWKEDSMYQIPSGRFNEDMSVEQFLFSQDPSFSFIESNPKDNFTIKSVFQGMAVKLGTRLYYIADFDPFSPTLLDSNVRAFTTQDSSLFWVNLDHEIHEYNLLLSRFQTFDAIPELARYENQDIQVFYYYLWRRIVIYTPDNVWTIWFDKDILNPNIVEYPIQHWIQNSQCIQEIQDRFQFCAQNNRLVAFRNTSLW